MMRPSQSGTAQAIDAYLEHHLDRPNVPGTAIAIVEGDQIVHQHSFGQARPHGPPPSPQTPFVLGSITKSITVLAVMQLVEHGKVGLDDSVQRPVPWFRLADPRAAAQVTVRQLLIQTSGPDSWSGWVPMADFDSSPAAAEKHARTLATYRLTRPLGSAFEYSNSNYDLLELIVEAASGESYADYVQDYIFGLLAMRLSYTSREEAARAGLAMGHRYWFGYPVAVPATRSPRWSVASGGLISCTEDLAHHLIVQLNEGRYGEVQVLSPAGIAEMQRPAVSAWKMLSVPLGTLRHGLVRPA
jgi:CubicO group peptidase (beta-lactamase class C family)